VISIKKELSQNEDDVPSQRITIVTDKPVAIDSPDHLQPHGTARDSSVNRRFNYKLQKWIPSQQLRVLDLGCSGGGFVKSILGEGGIAVGIEGSDYSQKHRRAEWATIPEYLFTADITSPFQLLETDAQGSQSELSFNVVTAWEVIEHIREDQLPLVFENISRHLLPGGIVIMSISPNEEVIQGVRLHQTVADKGWWLNAFARLGFVNHEEVVGYFGRYDWVRSEDNAPGSFQVVLTRHSESLPNRARLEALIGRAKFTNRMSDLSYWPVRLWRRDIKPMLYRMAPTWLKDRYRRRRNKRQHEP
jgi:2-polyprenyl-3-methyl-5-hydroxy-6-metoxy-1,4-benzoquinol methylase